MGKSTKVVAPNDGDADDYKAQNDADLMTRHQELMNDPDRFAAATEHLGKKASAATDAHQSARKQLEKKTKGRLKKTFGNNPKAEQAGPSY